MRSYVIVSYYSSGRGMCDIFLWIRKFSYNSRVSELYLPSKEDIAELDCFRDSVGLYAALEGITICCEDDIIICCEDDTIISSEEADCR